MCQLTASVICMVGIVWCVLSSGGCVRVCEHGGAVLLVIVLIPEFLFVHRADCLRCYREVLCQVSAPSPDALLVRR